MRRAKGVDEDKVEGRDRGRARHAVDVGGLGSGGGMAKGVARAAQYLVEQRGGLVELRRLRPDSGVEDSRQPLLKLVEDQPAKQQGRNEARAPTTKPRQAKAGERTKCACVRACTCACAMGAMGAAWHGVRAYSLLVLPSSSWW